MQVSPGPAMACSLGPTIYHLTGPRLCPVCEGFVSRSLGGGMTPGTYPRPCLAQGWGPRVKELAGTFEFI